ncbi:hypothetical protein [Lacipirellula sp.]|uniref:hypothetical protein n=1 Tax=Lacipirellula sp. TaxID=2691419 RepID=UPI003D1307D3
MLVTNRDNDGLFSVVSAGGIVVWRASYDYSLKAIVACGFSEAEGMDALAAPADAATFRSTAMAGIVSDLESLQELSESVTDNAAKTEAIKESITRLSGEITQAKEAAERERYRADLAHRISVWEADLKSRVSVVLNDAPNLEPAAAYQLLLNSSPGLVRMKQELEKLNG